MYIQFSHTIRYIKFYQNIILSLCDIVDLLEMLSYKNVFKRLWTAIKYVCGYKCKYGYYDEIILGKDKIKQLRDLCDSFLNE